MNPLFSRSRRNWEMPPGSCFCAEKAANSTVRTPMTMEELKRCAGSSSQPQIAVLVSAVYVMLTPTPIIMALEILDIFPPKAAVRACSRGGARLGAIAHALGLHACVVRLHKGNVGQKTVLVLILSKPQNRRRFRGVLFAVQTWSTTVRSSGPALDTHPERGTAFTASNS